MQTVTLNDGHQIPAIGYGTWRVRDEESEALVIEALALGYRHIDTAMIYKNEDGVGKGIANSGINREDIFVTTKLWITDQADPEAALATSLRKLKLDYVDLYLIHWPAPSLNIYPSSWDGLIRLRDKGLAKSIGVSNFNPNHLEALKPSGVVPAVNQIEIHPSHQNTGVAEVNTAMGIRTECYCPLGRGHYFDDPTLTEIAATLGATPAQIILAWHMSKGYIPLPKTVTPSRLKENLQAVDLHLPPDAQSAIDQIPQAPKICGDPDDFAG